jgi:predicted GIY-YIG superfamily endonuclease
MFYVYLLRSEGRPEKTYIGFTKDLKRRLADHNGGRSPHTAKFRPWKLECYLSFADEETARGFERYLKTSSGAGFAKKRLWRRAPPS